MKNLLFLIPLLFAGCTHYVEIHTGEAIAIDHNTITLRLVTNENLSGLLDSYWCYEPILSYNVYSSIGRNNNFPFSAKSVNYSSSVGKIGFDSEWKIPTQNKIIIGGNTYSYDIDRTTDMLFMVKIHGATMGGGHLESNVINIRITRPK